MACSGTLLTDNPNPQSGNGAGATNPFRLDRTQAATNDQDHDYTPEQLAFDDGLMDLFPLSRHGRSAADRHARSSPPPV